MVAAGKSLRADTVIEGTIRQCDCLNRISVQMIDVNRSTVIWAEKFDAEMADIFLLEDRIADELSGALALQLPADKLLPGRHHTHSGEAYDNYLKGRFFINRWQTQRAIEYFESALASDPNYALAHAGLADAHAKLGFGQGTLTPSAQFEKAKLAAQKALELDANLPEAHVSMGMIQLHYDWDWPAAERSFQRAIELRPNSPDGHHGFGQFLMAMGRNAEGLAALERARKLDPLSPDIAMHIGLALHGAGRNQESLAQFRELVQFDPQSAGGHALMAWVYEETGEYERACREHEEALRLDPGPSWRLANLARAKVMAGEPEAGRKLIERLLVKKNSEYVSATSIAEIFAALGDCDQALEWLEEAFRNRDSLLAYLGVSRRFGKLRSDPHFQDLLKRMRFASALTN